MARKKRPGGNPARDDDELPAFLREDEQVTEAWHASAEPKPLSPMPPYGTSRLARWTYGLQSAVLVGIIAYLVLGVSWLWLNPVFPLGILGGIGGALGILFTLTWWMVALAVVGLALVAALGRRGGRMSVKILIALAAAVLGPLGGVAMTYAEEGMTSEDQLTLALIYVVLAVYLLVALLAAVILVYGVIFRARRRR